MKKNLLLMAIILITIGCVDTTKIESDLTDVKTQMWRLQKDQSEQMELVKKINDSLIVDEYAQKNNANFIASIDEINANINILYERVKDLNEKMMIILSKLSSKNNSLDNESKNNKETVQNNHMNLNVTSKEQMFSIAYSDFLSEKYEVSIFGFNDFIKNNPDSDKVDNAYYYVGYCYFNLGKYRESIKAYETIINDYPDSDVRISAILRKALSKMEISLPRGSVELKALISEYPQSQEARIARQKLDELNIPHQ